MIPFTIRNGLAAEISRFQATVDQMFEGTSTDPDQECYVMIDEAIVSAGNPQRRPGLHVDGYWHPSLSCHGGGSHDPKPRHAPTPPNPPKKRNEALLLASNYSAARALVGDYDRNFIADWRGGDCSDLPIGGLNEIILNSNVAYHMDVFTLHESLPVRKTVQRTLVRINAPC